MFEIVFMQADNNLAISFETIVQVLVIFNYNEKKS